ncbi:MAG: hypothetical protein HYY96_15945 [Candidatus Tectomicrobia bacterium]|nr:hypothetical protein [Candidatus Tectomicrobia bacterium]
MQAFKLAALLSFRPNLDVLGPVGAYAIHRMGAGGLRLLLIGSLLLWSFLPLSLALSLFSVPRDE